MGQPAPVTNDLPVRGWDWSPGTNLEDSQLLMRPQGRTHGLTRLDRECPADLSPHGARTPAPTAPGVNRTYDPRDSK